MVNQAKCIACMVLSSTEYIYVVCALCARVDACSHVHMYIYAHIYAHIHVHTHTLHTLIMHLVLPIKDKAFGDNFFKKRL